MKHEIKQFTFGEKAKRGWHIDHKDVPVAISITPNEGDFLLHMAEMPCPMCLPGDCIKSVEVVAGGDTAFSLFVNYTGRRGFPDQYEERLLIGQSRETVLLEEAHHFVESLNQTFYEQQRGVPK